MDKSLRGAQENWRGSATHDSCGSSLAALIQQAKVHSDAGNRREALRLLREALREFPGLPRVAISLAREIERALKDVVSREDVSSQEIRNLLQEYGRLPHIERPGTLHSLILMRATQAVERFPIFISFLKWWNPANFLLSEATAIRKTIASGFHNRLRIKSSPPQIVAIKEDELSARFIEANKDARLPQSVCVAYSNATCLNPNVAIRSARSGGAGMHAPAEGDVLLVIRNNSLTGLLNGDLVSILSADSDCERVKVPVGEERVEMLFRDIQILTESEQGGEWDDVFVYFEHSRTDALSLRWAYTALTRARSRVFGINLPNRQPWTGAIPPPLGPASAGRFGTIGKSHEAELHESAPSSATSWDEQFSFTESVLCSAFSVQAGWHFLKMSEPLNR